MKRLKQSSPFRTPVQLSESGVAPRPAVSSSGTGGGSGILPSREGDLRLEPFYPPLPSFATNTHWHRAVVAPDVPVDSNWGTSKKGTSPPRSEGKLSSDANSPSETMKANPYEPATADSHLQRRPVRRYLASTVVCIFAAGMIAAPGLFLLIQRWNANRMRVGIYDAEFAGQPISISAMIAWSLGLSVPLWLTSFGFVYLAWRNYRRNRQTVAE